MEHEKLKRVIQESVPGKQVTLAHVIAHPDADLYKKLGVLEPDAGALGILTITPTEGAIIAADVATKAADVTLAFVDRFSGAVVVFGDVQSVQTALEAVVRVLNETLSFAPAPITKS
ncbi:MAG: BMC domain-containing protein [Pygmaiobacter massiliensis]|nr:BMC domain-containing protein [Pygmaiobacter massiliensis]